MTRGEQIFLGGFTGAGLGLCIDIIIPGSVPYGAIIGLIIGLISAINNKNSPDIIKNMTTEDYKKIYQNLNNASITNICQSIVPVLNAYNMCSLALPTELLKIANALSEILKEKKFGNLSNEKTIAVNRSIAKFHDDIEFWLPVLLRTMNVAADKGLDFGIIGSAADVALYSVMDTIEKKNNFNSAHRSSNDTIDRKVRELTTAIQNALL